VRTVLYPTLDAAQKSALRTFVRAAASAQFLGYHCPDYQDGMSAILGDTCQHLLTLDADGTIIGYMPYREKTTALGTVVNALPFFGPNGLILARDDAVRTSLLHAFVAAVDRPAVLSAVIYTPFLETAPIGDLVKADRRIERFTQYLHLPDATNWPKKRRGDLKRAAAGGFILRDAKPADAAELYRIYAENCAEAGIPLKPPAYIDLTIALSSAAGGDDGWFRPLWLVAEKDGRVVAGLLAMCGGRTMSYTIPLAEATVRADQPVALLIDTAISHARAAGYSYWNFESSPAAEGNVFKYKERWGASMGTYEVLVLYPNGRALAEAIEPADLKRTYPFYFVRPY
jgi:hypothetical protein